MNLQSNPKPKETSSNLESNKQNIEQQQYLKDLTDYYKNAALTHSC